MKIQENLVWDKHSGELIGFVDLGDININYGTLQNVQKLGNHVLVFLLKSVANSLSYSFEIFSQTVKYHERINLKVIAATASQSRKFFRMHKYLCGDSDDVIYRTKNIHTTDMLYIYFFADAPHLVKTVQNCLYRSWSEPETRCGTMVFSFMVTYSSLVLSRLGEWVKIGKQTHKRPHKFNILFCNESQSCSASTQ